uniref:Uncharacterized protein n=1 Tax=Uncultured archaeon GZfos26G2 TaxID=3386331 RepID=Q64A28_UNCAG|nr:hypothetical protein GZ33E1_46 [uncultured archaeon GZfos33E1]
MYSCSKKPRDFTRLTQHFSFFTKRKSVLKEKKYVLLVKLFFKPLQGLRGREAETHIRKGFSWKSV